MGGGESTYYARRRMTGWLLRVEAPHFVAGAVFEKLGGKYRCTHAAPILRWMTSTDTRQIESYIKRKKWKYSWIAF